jgi:hypothetical protein
MARKNPTHYVGATKRLPLKSVGELGSRWALQPKKDGIYVRVYLNTQGRVAKVFMRNGREVPAHLTSHIASALVGPPSAELVGELEAMTEQAERFAKKRQRRIWLFDCLHDGERSLVGAPYHVRRDALMRMNARTQNYAPDDDHRPAPWRKYRDPSTPGWRLLPVVPQVLAVDAGRVWEEWVVGPDDGDEGLVAVNLDAPVGRAASKMKIKQSETIDARVTSASPTTVICEWRGGLFAVATGRHQAEAGDVVEVRCDGFYETGVLPRFPAIVRVRRDLQ